MPYMLTWIWDGIQLGRYGKMEYGLAPVAVTFNRGLTPVTLGVLFCDL